MRDECGLRKPWEGQVLEDAICRVARHEIHRNCDFLLSLGIPPRIVIAFAVVRELPPRLD
jgi:hypothetical protein